MTRFTITPRGPFSLAATERFFGRWEASSGVAIDADAAPAVAAGGGGSQRVAFLVDDDSGAAGMTVEQAVVDGPVEVEIVSGAFADADRVRAQLTRVFSLDHDGSGYAAVGERDAVIGASQAKTAFLRPVLFHSPYEAACWSIISARIHHTQARRIRTALSGTLAVDGTELEVFPSPQQLLQRAEISGLNDEKVVRLHGIARAALEGTLDRERLLALEPEVALQELQALRGIGPFSASLILLRAVGPVDVLPDAAARVRQTIAAAYDRPELERDGDAIAALADGWRPYRTWVTVLLGVTSGLKGRRPRA